MENRPVNNREAEIRSRVQQLREESPWFEDYEIEAIICTEFDLEKYNVSEIHALTDTKIKPGGQTEYDVIQTDEIGKFGAYSPVNKGASQRKDFGTRALYSLLEKNSAQNAGILDRARQTISVNVKRESRRIGFTLLLYFVIMGVISVALVGFTVLIMGWSIDEVNTFISNPRNTALLHAGILLLGLGFPFVAYIFIHKLPVGEMVPLHKLRSGELMPMVWMGLALMMVDGCFVNYVSYPGALRGANYSFDVMSFGSSFSDIALTLVCLAIIPALIETFVFDGVILQVFRRRGGDAFALMTSALLYAIMTTNFIEMPGAFITAMWLGYMVVFSGSLVPAVVTRLIERLLFFIVTQLGFSTSLGSGIHYLDCGISIFIILIGLLNVAVMLRRFPEFFVLKRSDPCLTVSQKVEMSVSRWSVVVLMVISLVFSAVQLVDLPEIINMVTERIYG